MDVTLVFSRKYRSPAHFFSVWFLGNPQKLLTANQFLVSTMFFTIRNISFFSLHFDLFSIIAKEVNQIRNNVVCVVARLARVLRPIFPDYVVSCDYASSEPQKINFRFAEGKWKQIYYNHKKSFNHKRYSHETALSSYVWYLKETLDVTPNLKWSVVK